MSRCEICNFSDLSDGDCTEDVGDIRPKRCSVHYYADLKQELCSYCHTKVTKNRKFYSWFFKDGDSQPKNDFIRRKQNNKKTTPKVPAMSE